MLRTSHRAAAVALASIGAMVISGCGLTRSEVKTLGDRDAPRIAFDTVIPTTVSALNALPSRCGPAGNRRRSAEEFTVYQVTGLITRVRRERDRDVHIVLADPANPRDRVVIELGDPDTRHGRRSPYRERLIAAQRTFARLQRERGARSVRDIEGLTVSVTGVGFFDAAHLQRGRSRSCIELHPVLSIAVVPST